MVKFFTSVALHVVIEHMWMAPLAYALVDMEEEVVAVRTSTESEQCTSRLHHAVESHIPLSMTNMHTEMMVDDSGGGWTVV